MININRMLAITKKEFIQIIRDKPSLVIALAMPILMIFLFGYAVRTDVNNVSTAYLDMDKTEESRKLLDAFTNTGYYDLKIAAASRAQISNLIDSGKAKAAVIIPHGFEKQLLSGQKPSIQVLIDGSDPMISRTALANSIQLTQNYSARLSQSEMLRSTAAQPVALAFEAIPRVWYNPTMESVKFNIPGLIGLIMQNITIMLTAFALVRERERGTLEQLIVTPLKPSELMLGKLIPYVVIAFISVALVMGVGVLWFGMVIKGSTTLLLGCTFIFLLGALGIGLMISTVSRTQLQAMQMSFFFILPSVLLSGFMFPRAAMPQIIQWLGLLIPMTYFLDILRGIILKGNDFQLIASNLGLLTLFGGGILTLATSKFHKNLD